MKKRSKYFFNVRIYERNITKSENVRRVNVEYTYMENINFFSTSVLNIFIEGKREKLVGENENHEEEGKKLKSFVCV